MANRVNIKFVVILSAVLIVISAGVAFLAVKVVSKSAEDHIRLGDTASAAGDYRVAASHYSKAVAEDQLNKVYLHKWVDALKLNVPANEQLLNEKFYNDLMPAYENLAKADPNDPIDQLVFLNLRLAIFEYSGGYRVEWYSQLTDMAQRFIEHHERTHPDDKAWWPLRRFNAIATALAASSNTGPKLASIEAAMDDARAALEANPDDIHVAMAMYSLLDYRAGELKRQQLPGAIEAAEAVEAFVASAIDKTTPGSIARMSAETTRLSNKMRGMLEELKETLTSERAAIAMGQRVGELRPALDALFERIGEADEVPDYRLIRRLMDVERSIAPTDGLPRSLEVIDRAVEKRPEDVELLKLRATLETMIGDAEAAIVTYKKIGTFEPKAIDLESILRRHLRTDALYQLAELNYMLADQTSDEAEHLAHLNEVKSVRDKLAERVASDSPELQLIDARIALTEGHTVEAQAMLDRLNRQTQFTNPDALWLAGASAAKNRQPGLARQRFRQLVEMHPRTVKYRLALAEMEIEVGNGAEALAQMRVALELDPTSPDILANVQQLETVQGLRTADDPVEAALIDAKRISDGTGNLIGNPKAAIERLERAVEEIGPDRRLISNLARQYVLGGSIEEARAIVKAGLDASPNDEDMGLLSDAVQSGSRVQVIEYFLNQLEGKPGEIAVAKWLTLQRLNEPEAAEKWLDTAIELAPDNASVLEARMARAMNAEDFALADTVAERAAEADADGAGGATFFARVQRGKGNTDGAIATLREATDRYPNNAGLWRLLGLMHSAVSQQTDALAAYNRALDILPNLTPVINAKIRTLLALGQTREALQFKRNQEQIARNDDEFVDLHLMLEGEYGDAGLARSQREQRATLNPSDLGNRAQLAGLLIRDSQFARAAAIVDDLEDEVDDPRSLTTLRATLQAEQGNFEAARSIFAREIAAQRPDERANSYLRLYSFLNDRGRATEALNTLVQALPWQLPERMLVDKTLGDVLMSMGNFEGANESYTRIRNAGSDGGGGIWEQRRIETLIRLNKLDEAVQALAALPASERSLHTRLLEADLTIRQGDFPKARALLDTIVAENPDSALVYVKRAEAMSDSPELEREQLLDLNKAIELQPNFWQAYRARAGVLAPMQRTDEAIADLRKAVELNPSLDTVRLNLVEYLVTQGRTDDALEIAREALALKPKDTDLRDRLGLVFAQGDRRREATQMYRSALELTPTPARAVRVLDLLLTEKPPRTVEAENLLALPIMTSLIAEDGGLRLMRARVYYLQGRSDAALRESVEAYRAMRPIARDMLVWFNFVETMIEDRAGTLVFLDRFEAEPGTQQWAKLFRGILLMGSEDTRPDGIRLLEQHAASTADSEVAFTAWRSLGARSYEAEDYAKAIEYWQQAIDKRPNDTTVLNNIAYTYSARLDDPARAVPMASRAAELAPNDSDVLHTLGVSLLRSDRAQEALGPLNRARMAAQTPTSWVTASVHYAEALHTVGQVEPAKEVIEAIQSRMNDPSVLNDVLREDYIRLRAALGMN